MKASMTPDQKTALVTLLENIHASDVLLHVGSIIATDMDKQRLQGGDFIMSSAETMLRMSLGDALKALQAYEHERYSR